MSREAILKNLLISELNQHSELVHAAIIKSNKKVIETALDDLAINECYASALVISETADNEILKIFEDCGLNASLLFTSD